MGVSMAIDNTTSFRDASKRKSRTSPERAITLLVQFLRRNSGVLSKRARARDFRLQSAAEMGRVEGLYERCLTRGGGSISRMGAVRRSMALSSDPPSEEQSPH